jgi:hypothetical protein
LEGTAWTYSFRCPYRGNQLEFDPATEESALDVQYIFLSISSSTRTRSLPHRALEFCLAEATTYEV